MSDIEIAQHAKMKPIIGLTHEKLGIPAEHLDPYGHYKAKLSLEYVDSLTHKKEAGKLILVTAISPTPAGEGKTTTTVGLGDALNRIGKKTIMCIREPSLGPCFGMKGGAAGGGYSQVVPMEDINLHFTGDFHAIGVAHNLLAAMIDNHINHGNALDIDPRRITWKRVVDMNDRALRQITIGQGGPANGHLREDGFDIVVASEVMAILCLATNRADLKERLGRIVIGYKYDKITPVYASELNAHGAMAALLKDAIKPNIVQTLENNLAIVHGGPFANIAHGCNSVMATQTALKLADYAVTEAGFGADLGAEKFINIKCRASKLAPSAVVLVATVRALKYHGGVDKKHLNQENLEALQKGFANLERHIQNVTDNFKLPCVVCLNHFTFDSDEETELVIEKCRELGLQCIVSKHWAEGGQGAEALAHAVIDLIEAQEAPPQLEFLYDKDLPIWEKIETIATRLYGAANISASDKVKADIRALQEAYGDLPICMAKTQMSFSTNPELKGAPSGHTVEISDVKLKNGAGFIVAIAG
ncbi:MAG: formate--tetrahydrofolate ligase, partial [Hydrogenovibrio sp.]|nr:formate--tetrahydrofolate ligase [Hydrogenovibrio sp.]